ncbi:MAG: energy-coupling factor transporter transmembrane protein EcfT [Lachnospiraceae bacterium]|nr:energy-coupling factor transporter transmembrane protein EcfT [Lachnospiraceae bacterium]
MLRDITIGQYYREESVIHRLDPRVKLAGTFIYIILLFIFDNIWGYALATLAFAVVVKASRIPLKFILKGLRPILFLLLLTVFFNMFFVTGTHVILQYGIIRITWEGLKSAAFMGIRLILLILGSSLMTYTTTPNHLTDGLEKGLNWMNKFKVPIHEIAMMMSIALRFIPILLEETDIIMKAQSARGVDFEHGRVWTRAKNMVPILVPLFISAFRRANDLARAMEARCYRGGEGRTKMKPLVYARRDRAAYLLVVVYIALLIAGDRTLAYFL